MSQVLVHASAWVEKTNASASVNFPIHASARAGDVAVVVWSWNSATLPGQASGWTMLDEVGSTTDTLAPACSIHRKTVTSTDVTNGYVTMAVHTSVGSGAAVVLQGYSVPHVLLVPLDKTATSSNFAFGALGALPPDTAIVYICGQNTVQTGSFTPPTNFTEIGDRVAGRNAEAGYYVNGSGANISPTAVASATTRGVGVLAAFKPTDNPRMFAMLA